MKGKPNRQPPSSRDNSLGPRTPLMIAAVWIKSWRRRPNRAHQPMQGICRCLLNKHRTQHRRQLPRPRLCGQNLPRPARLLPLPPPPFFALWLLLLFNILGKIKFPSLFSRRIRGRFHQWPIPAALPLVSVDALSATISVCFRQISVSGLYACRLPDR